MGMTVKEGKEKGRRGEEEKGGEGPKTNMPRWAHWRWGEKVDSRHENTPIWGAFSCLFGGRGWGGRQEAEHHQRTHFGTLVVV